MIDRRTLITTAAVSALGLAVPSRTKAAENSSRRFSLDLRCGSIGVKANQVEAIELALQHGFESVTPAPGYLSKLSSEERSSIADKLAARDLRWGAAGLPVQFRKDESTFKNDLAKLPDLVAALKDVDATRIGTYIMPCHNELTYVSNFRLHAQRLRQCAAICADAGLQMGLEYVGPKTLWTSMRYSFVHSLKEMNDLIAEIGTSNVGLILDSWHWYTAGETVDDLLSLNNDQIVACDLNDAPEGLAVDQQLDNMRELPMETGVINLQGFLSALVQIGYDGPVRAEPFNKPLNQLDNQAAAAKTAAAMKKAFTLVD